MSLNIHYDTMKNYTENFSDNAIKQADTLGLVDDGNRY